jgi:SPP1 gp7 family putative phage head morphogenesis protein
MPSLKKLPRSRFNNRHRMPRQQQPDGIRLSYYTQLRKIAARCSDLVRARVLSVLPDLLAQVHPTLDESSHKSAHLDADPSGRVVRLIRSISEKIAKEVTQEKLIKIVSRIASATSEHQKTQLFRQIKAGTGVELSTIADRGLSARIKHFTAENVSLIQSIPRDYFQDVESTLLSGMRDATRHEKLAEEIEGLGDVAKNRAKLIARDQVGKFYGGLNRVRQGALGIDQYIWRTAGDERVRTEHVERDGEVYSWDDPPGEDPDDPATGGHPGMAIQCRCYAEPNLAPIMDELTGVDESDEISED